MQVFPDGTEMTSSMWLEHLNGGSLTVVPVVKKEKETFTLKQAVQAFTNHRLQPTPAIPDFFKKNCYKRSLQLKLMEEAKSPECYF